MGVGVISLPGSCGGRGGRCPPSPSPGVASPGSSLPSHLPPHPTPPTPGSSLFRGKKVHRTCVPWEGGGEMSFTPLLHLTPGASFFSEPPRVVPPPIPGSSLFWFRGGSTTCYVRAPPRPPVHRPRRHHPFPMGNAAPRRRDVSAPSPMETPSPRQPGEGGFHPLLLLPSLPLPSPGTLRAWMFRARSSPPPVSYPRIEFIFRRWGG